MQQLTQFKTALLLSLLTIAFGFGLGAAFGANEAALKGDLKARGEAALETVYKGDTQAMEKVVSKSWVYYKRAHLHANGLGTSALVIVLLLAALPSVNFRWRWITAIAQGVGSLGYSLYWLFAGMRAPSMGDTHIAKESLDFLAIPGSGCCILGLVSVIVIVCVAKKGGEASS